jgi:hypothetical protein
VIISELDIDKFRKMVKVLVERYGEKNALLYYEACMNPPPEPPRKEKAYV